MTRGVSAAVVALGLTVGLFVAPAQAAEGDISFVECVEDSGSAAACRVIAGNDGLAGAENVAVSPDGAHVYVVAGSDSALSVFTRNPNTGNLEITQGFKDGLGGVDGLASARDVAVSDDGGSVYVTGFNDNAVAAFTRNPSTGKLAFVEAEKDGVGGVDGIAEANSVTVSPDGGHVYITGFGENTVATFARNRTTSALTFVGCKSDFTSGSPLSSCPSTGGIDGLNSAWDTSITPDGRFLYATGPGDDAVALFSRNTATGALSFIRCLEDTGGGSTTCASTGLDGLDNAVYSQVSPDGRHLYVVSETDQPTPGSVSRGAITTFAINGDTGDLSFVQTIKDSQSGANNLGGALDLAISGDGKHVFVTSQTDDGLTVFSRNGITGALTFQQNAVDGASSVEGINTATGVAVSPDDRHVYVAGRIDAAVALFARDPDVTAPATIGFSGPGASTSDKTPSFTFSTNDPGFARFECKVDNGPFEACSSPFTSFALADGPHQVHVRARDTAGNVEKVPAAATFTVATPVPTGPVGPQGPAGSPGSAGVPGAVGQPGDTGPAGRDAQVTCKITKKKAKKVKARCTVVLGASEVANAQWQLRSRGDVVDRGISKVSAGRVTVKARLAPGRYSLFVKGQGRAGTFVVR